MVSSSRVVIRSEAGQKAFLAAHSGQRNIRSLFGGSCRPRESERDLRIALCVPLGGTSGIWGPSALASAQLAVAELNQACGIAGQACRLLTVNAADDAVDLEGTLLELVSSGEVDALVGMHTSDVRQRILAAVGGQIPFIYTPLYEGGESTPGVFAIGETSIRQLRPAIAWLSQSRRPQRWMFLGNDYVWPRMSNQQARACVGECSGEVVAEEYLPFGTGDYTQVLDQIRRSRADAVLVSVVGQDAVEFNRAFGRSKLSRTVLRLSCAMGENELLAIGAEGTENLYVASGYFASLETDANLAFKERYRNHFGERSPTLNTFGQSAYEGVHFLAALFNDILRTSAAGERFGQKPLTYRSARGAVYAVDGVNQMPIYLARAEGHTFRVITRL